MALYKYNYIDEFETFVIFCAILYGKCIEVIAAVVFLRLIFSPQTVNVPISTSVNTSIVLLGVQTLLTGTPHSGTFLEMYGP